MAPVQIYGPNMSTATSRVLLCLEELGAEYEHVPITFATSEHKSPEHLARNARLSKSKYLTDDFISFADISHIPVTYYFMGTPYTPVFDERPHLNAWWESLASRPSFKKVTSGMVAK
ncbi:hypothetical protein Cni_G25156 [Canna indica]|uniref:glutathione transferase n=1 Tax=Canna indica TaxID=4628 RepID=A0AAQ3KX62_9LILI|nr:hypothetical protein Cni_G25156 [Canna indica]